MAEADSHVKLLPPSILDIYKEFAQIDMLSKGIQLQPYTIIFILFGSDFGVLGHMSRVVWLSLSDVRVAKVRFAVDAEAHAVSIAKPNKQDQRSPLNCES
jgi:hypothetical protein